MVSALLRQDALRAHLAESRMIAAKGKEGVKALVAIITDARSAMSKKLALRVLRFGQFLDVASSVGLTLVGLDAHAPN
jgi:hypothetical protein